MQPDTNSSEREWIEFLELNSNAMFQVALLLSADVYTAEAALLNSIDELEIRRAPRRGMSPPGNMLSSRGALQRVQLKNPE